MPGSDLALMDPAKLATSSLLPAHMRDDPVNTAVIMFTLQAYDLPVTFFNFSETYVSKAGKPGMHAALQRVVAGHHGWVIEPLEGSPTAERCVVSIRHRRDPGPGKTVEFTWEDAVKAGLPERNPTYRLYPDRMLFARATTKAIMLHCPEVLRDAPPDVHLADVEEWEAAEHGRVPDEVYDDEPEAYADPSGEKYDPDDVTYRPDDPQRPFTE